MAQNPPCWRASYARGHPKQRKCKFVLMKSLCSGCPSGQLALQHGGFCTMWPLAAKGPFIVDWRRYQKDSTDNSMAGSLPCSSKCRGVYSSHILACLWEALQSNIWKVGYISHSPQVKNLKTKFKGTLYMYALILRAVTLRHHATCCHMYFQIFRCLWFSTTLSCILIIK